MSELNTGKTVGFTFDPANPPRLTPRTETTLAPDERGRHRSQRYFGTIASRELESPGLFGGPVGQLRREALKEKLPLVDDEVIEFFQQAGDNPADRMNAVLRAYAQTHRKTA